MNAINLKARKFNSKAELTLKYMQSLLKISKKEKTKTYQLVENMLMRLEKSEIKSILPTFLRETLQICNLAKSAEWLEGGMPHTHDKTVILPDNWFKEVTSYFKDLDNKIAFNGSTLMHELLHIHQRIKPDLYENIYRCFITIIIPWGNSYPNFCSSRTSRIYSYICNTSCSFICN